MAELVGVVPAPEPGVVAGRAPVPDEPAPQMLSREGRYSASPLAASAGRQLAAKALQDWGLLPLLDLDEVLVVVSELVTNAVEHAGRSQSDDGDREVLVRVRFRDSMLFVEVTDDAPALLNPSGLGADAEELEESGRGLDIVARLADEWGVSPADDGKVVWAKFGPTRCDVDGGCRGAAG